MIKHGMRKITVTDSKIESNESLIPRCDKKSRKRKKKLESVPSKSSF
jgi:hypothetical protein